MLASVGGIIARLLAELIPRGPLPTGAALFVAGGV